jgi:hypothetical protein
MPAPNLPARLPLLKLRRHVRHTLLKLRTRAWGRAAGALLAASLKEVDDALAAERRLADAIEDAETVADLADLELDACARAAWMLGNAHLSGGHRDEVREALFGESYLSGFIRPVLGPKLRAMRSWPRFLGTLAAAELKALGARVEAALKAADAAVGGLTQAEVELAAFRAGVQAALVKKVDLQLQGIFAEARRQAKETGVQTEDQGLFLLPSRRRPPPTLARARAVLAAREKELAQARAEVAALEAEAEAQARAESERQALRRRITALRDEQARKQAELVALEQELGKKR